MDERRTNVRDIAEIRVYRNAFENNDSEVRYFSAIERL